VKKKVKKSAKTIKEKDKPEQIGNEGHIKEEQFNYGGLPNRDLKKNLGCG